MRRPLATLMLCLYLLGSYAYSNRRITVSDGLSNNLVLCMAIDNDGYVWAGTESGLNRIGGGICTQIRPPLGWEHGFRGNADKVLSLYYDRQNGTLFVGTESGLDIVDSRTGIYRRAVGDSLPNYGIPDMGTDHHGGVWLFYNNGLIQRVGCGDLKVTTLPRTNGMGYYSGTDDGNGLLYTGHSKGGMDIVDSKTGLAIGTFVHEQGNESSLPGNNVRCIFQDRNRRIWVGTDHGLALFHPTKGIFQRIRHSGSLYDDNVYDIREMADGRLWVACDVGGIGIVDPRTMAYTEECPDGLSSLNTRSLLQDGYGNVWVGHHSTGIDVLSAGEPLLRQQPYTSAKGSMLAVGAICSDAAGRLWVNAEDELSLWLGEHKLAVWQIQGLRSHAHSFARSMMVGKDGRVWLGMEDEGVIRFDPATGRFEHIDIGYDAPDTHCFFEDEDGSIWIGTDFGVCTYKGGTVCHEENVTRVTRSAPVNSFLRMGETLLMATMGNGVILYNTQTGDHRKVEANYGLPTRNISQALADGHGGVWLATNKGIFFLPDIKNKATSVCYDKRQGLADQQVQAIALDHEGRLWASTFTHIACLDSGKERLFHNYDGYAQLTTGGFAVGAVAQTSEGVLAFGSTNGICFVRPQVANDDQDTVRPKIAVCNIYQPTADDMNTTALLSDNEGRLSLNYQQNTIQIVPTVDNYAQMGCVDMTYMMKGLDNKWYDMDKQTEVIFRSLPPGTYTFILKAKLKSQDWSKAQQTQLLISIAPPFWRSWWAWTLYALMTAGALWWFFSDYKRHLTLQNRLELSRRDAAQKQEQNEERLRFFTNITHELRTPLTLILPPLEDLAADSSLSAASRKRVELISKSAERLRDLVNQILEFRKTETQNRKLTVARGDIGQLVEETVLSYKDLNRNPRVDISYRQRGHLPELYFDSEVITTILNNLLSNAVKYTEEGSIEVSTEAKGDEAVAIRVADTGYGIAEEALPHIFERYYQAKGSHQASGTGIGLALVKGLADLHGAHIDVVSREGEGCVFTLTLSAVDNYPDALHKEEVRHEQTTEAMAPAADDHAEQRQPLLLVVEDNEDIRQYVAEALSYDFRVLQAKNGQEGLALARQHLPDLIVSDIMMPHTNGIEMTRVLKSDIGTCHIPVILLTAKSSDEDREEGYDSGADSYLTKPFTTRLLLSRIRNLLAARRQLAERVSNSGVEDMPADNTDATQPETLSRLDREFMLRLDTVIRENIMQKDIDMAFLTDRMAMSHSTFYRKVKALTGLTAKEYVRKQRLRQCYRLLQSGEYNVTEAAAMTGFNHLAHFREVFKREFGLLPSEVAKS